MTTRLGILETGRRPDELPDFDPYPKMVENWIGMKDAASTTYAVLDDEFPNGPQDADLWIITGSKHGAYDPFPWIARLEEFIRACHADNVPMIGICFGHQLIAQALGGEVRKSAKGWGLGLHDYAITNWPAALGDAPVDLRLQAFHQDQIETLPDGAEVLAKSDFCEFAALYYPGFAITVQGHPEFAANYTKELIQLRRGSVLPEDRVDAALEPSDRTSTRVNLGAVCRNWFAGLAGKEGPAE